MNVEADYQNVSSCSSFLTLYPFLSISSEGVLAYYWSQFDIPVKDLEIESEFSEERVLSTLESGMKKMRRTAGNRKQITISEVTASRRYHQGDQRKPPIQKNEANVAMQSALNLYLYWAAGGDSTGCKKKILWKSILKWAYFSLDLWAQLTGSKDFYGLNL